MIWAWVSFQDKIVPPTLVFTWYSWKQRWFYYTDIPRTPFLELPSYRKTSNISRTLVGNKIVDNSDVVVGAAPTTYSFST